LEIKTEINQSYLLVTIQEDINFENAKDLNLYVRDQAKNAELYLVVLNFEYVDLIDSSGLGTIISLLTFLQKNQGELLICGLNDNIDELFRLTKLDHLLKIYNHIDDAINEIEK